MQIIQKCQFKLNQMLLEVVCSYFGKVMKERLRLYENLRGPSSKDVSVFIIYTIKLYDIIPSDQGIWFHSYHKRITIM
jgi:hypothetical protein